MRTINDNIMLDSNYKIVLENVGNIDPMKTEDYISHGGYRALRKALTELKPEEVIDEVKNSNLRGRGGAGFPTGLKWSFTAPIEEEKYVLCNADEGEPGTFKDRLLMEGDPHKLIEGMIITGYAIGAKKGFIYIRGEYKNSIDTVKHAVEEAREKGYLGENIQGSGFNFDIDVMMGAGAYVCGEETALIESLEGKRGNPRIKPPFPGTSGIWNKPTVVNNVETLGNIPAIIANGANWFKSIGPEKSPGTKVFSILGQVNNPGAVEAPMGITLRELIYDYGKGIKDNKKFKAALVGGAAGVFLPESMLDIKMDYDTLKENDAVLGSGAVLVMNENADIFDMLINVMEFFKHESCGQCSPCRIGNPMILKILGQIKSGKGSKEHNWNVILKTAEAMKETSLCALGQSAIMPLSSAYKHFNNELMN